MPMAYAQVRPYLRYEILERVAKGERLKAICAEPFMPCRESVTGWARADPAFAQAYATAKAQGAHRRVWRYDPPTAKAIIARLAAGETIAQALKNPGAPSWRVFRYWRMTQAEFQSEVARLNEVKRREKICRNKRRLRPFDPATGDKILYRVAMGEPLRRVLGSDKRFPCLAVLARWRKENRAFNEDLRIAMKGARYRRGARRLWSEALQEEILMRIIEGASFRDIAKDPQMPCLTTLSNWMRRRPGFVDPVAEACDEREFVILERQLDIARAATGATLAQARRRIAELEWRRARLRRRPAGGRGGRTFD
jgi:hypothetical protein